MSSETDQNELFVFNSTPAATHCEWLLKVKRPLFAGGVLLALSLIASCVAVGYQLIIATRTWLDELPQGVMPSIDSMVAECPEIFVISIVGGLLGLCLAAVGLWITRKILGPDNLPPAKVLGLVTVLPLGCCGMGTMMLLSTSPMGAAVMLPWIISIVLALVPVQVLLLAYGLSTIALQQLTQTYRQVESSDLPREAQKYFSASEVQALKIGLMPLGDFSFAPQFKHKRCWMALNGSYFVEAVWAKVGNNVIKAVCVSTTTSDGRYFEVADCAPVGQLGNRSPNDPRAAIAFMPGATVAGLIDHLTELVSDWVAKSDVRPMEFAAGDLHALSEYGICVVAQGDFDALMWLANPLAKLPIPTPPGTTWQPEPSSAATVAPL